MSELFASFSVSALDAFFPASFCVARLGEVLDIRFFTEKLIEDFRSTGLKVNFAKKS